MVWNHKTDYNILLEKDSNGHPTRNYNRSYWLAQLQYVFNKKNENSEHSWNKMHTNSVIKFTASSVCLTLYIPYTWQDFNQKLEIKSKLI